MRWWWWTKDEKGSGSFLKKRTKKLFPFGANCLGFWGLVGGLHPPYTAFTVALSGLQWVKVFCFFFSKKKRLLFFFCPSGGH
jgi:hypothetical protein